MTQRFTNIKISPITEKVYNGTKLNISYLDEAFGFKKDEMYWFKIDGKRFNIGKFFHLYRSYGSLWFRIFGKYGLSIRNTQKTFTLFSERNGYSKFYDIGKYRIKILK